MARQYAKLDLSKLQRFVAGLQKDVIKTVNEVAEHTQDIAVQLAPEETGFLKQNIKITKRATLSDPTAIVSSLARYSRFVEHGTVNMDPIPYMYPAKLLGEVELENRLGALVKGWGTGRARVLVDPGEILV